MWKDWIHPQCCLRYYKHMNSTHTSVFAFIIYVSNVLNLNVQHNNTRIKASKVSNVNEVCKWLLIVLCFCKSPFTNCDTWGNDKYFLPKFHENLWPIGIPLVDALQNCHASYYDLFSMEVDGLALLQTMHLRSFVYLWIMILLSFVALFIQ